MLKKNISFSLLANITRLVFGLILFVMLSRIFELQTFGIYVYMLVIAAFFTMLIDFGFNLSVLNDVPKNKERIKSFFYEIVISKSILVLVGIVILILFLYLTKETNNIYAFFVFIAAAIVQSFSVLITSLFKAFNRFDVDFYFAVINNSVPLILIYIFYEDISLVLLAYVYLISRVIGFYFVLLYFFKQFSQVSTLDKIRVDLKPIIKNLKYAVHMIAGGFFLTIDIPIMKEILGFDNVAIYSAGMKIFVALMMIGDVLNTSFIPKLSENINKDYSVFVKTISQLNLMMFIFGLFFASLVLLIGKPIILLVFGIKFELLITLLPFFSLALFIRYFSLSYGTLITLAEKQHIRAYIMVVVFISHIIFNIVFQSELGIQGAIISLCISFVILMFSNMYIVYRHYGRLFLVWERT